MHRLLLAVVASAGAAALTPVPALGASSVRYFETPSGKIVCAWVEESLSFQDDVVCEVRTAFHAAVAKSVSSCGHLGHSKQQVVLRGSGRVILAPCDSDRLFAQSPTFVLRAGKTLEGGGLECSEATTGLTCRNSDHHGFFLSPSRWRSF